MLCVPACAWYRITQCTVAAGALLFIYSFIMLALEVGVNVFGMTITTPTTLQNASYFGDVRIHEPPLLPQRDDP